jgi:predicted GNAT family acetyltransferase
MDAFEITRDDNGTRGRYVVLLDGLEAELTYQRQGQVLVADHTLVPPEFRGKGIAEQLVQRLVADARAEGNRIEPVCSYVELQFRRHKEWADLRA